MQTLVASTVTHPCEPNLICLYLVLGERLADGVPWQPRPSQTLTFTVHMLVRMKLGTGADGVIAAVLITLLACLVHSWWKKGAVWRALVPQGGRTSTGQYAAAGSSAGKKLPPGSLGLPWVGESISLLAAMRAGDHDRFLRDRTARFASQTFKTVIFNQKTVVMQGTAANRFIAACENKGLLRNAWPASMLAVVGKGAPVAMHGAEHRRLRHILLSCLSPVALHKLVARAHTLTVRHFACTWPHAQALHLSPLLNLHTFRLACSLLANVTDEHVLARLQPHFNAWLAGMVDLPLDFPGTSYRRSRLAGDALRQEMGSIIDRKLEALKSASSCATGVVHSCADVVVQEDEDVLSMLLKTQDESGGFLSRHEMQDVLLFLLFAGRDTTTTALTFALKFLEQNPACLDLVVQEQEEIAHQKKPGERLNWADVQSMRYTWRVIQETMRLRPPVTASMKQATDDLVFEGYHIPKGWKVYLSIAATHADEQYFRNASTFNPSRFDPDEVTPTPFAHVPFGVGPHSCPGNEFARMTICVYLHELVRHFKWASLNPHEKVSISTFPTLVQGYPVTIFQKKPF